jgi:aminoglycoside phosphotransferase (APT) family kinase protein/FMN phosphatase YigB (HAD superfamily)
MSVEALRGLKQPAAKVEVLVPKTDVVLLFDYGGVVGASPLPAVRRYTEFIMETFFARLVAAGLLNNTEIGIPALSKQYSNLYFQISRFAESAIALPAGAGTRTPVVESAWSQLERGAIRRRNFVTLFAQETVMFLKALRCKTADEVTALGFRQSQQSLDQLRQRLAFLTLPEQQEIFLELFDAASFLAVIEKCAPRKNVLNMLHFLRATTHQEIRVGIVTNNWESEGHYVLNTIALERTGMPVFLPVYCPLEYESQRRGATFDTNALFDVVAQSYIIGSRKPEPGIFVTAVEAVTGVGVPQNDAQKRMPQIFFFDDILKNCEAARKLTFPNSEVPMFSKVFNITNGPLDVYQSVVKALRSVGADDPYWMNVATNLETTIGPLFARNVAGGGGGARTWVDVEANDLDENLLHLPPPPNPALEPMSGLVNDNKLTLDEKNRVLVYLSRQLPQNFPLVCPEKFDETTNLSDLKSVATSNGPCLFEYFKGGMSNPTYRITLRTGSYVLRKQPRGKLLGGAHDLQREYEICRHLSKTSQVPVPECLHYCDDLSVVGQKFYVMRYVDGKIIRRIDELVSPPFSRPFSHRRVLSKTQLNPTLFIHKALDVLALLHNASIPPFLQRTADSIRVKQQSKQSLHPVLHLVNVWARQYGDALKQVQSKAPKHVAEVRSDAFEHLTEAIRMSFDHEDIPMPTKVCLTHGDYKLDNMMFSHRSLEGRPKYPPKILSLLDFELANIGDPLTDVAYMALMHLLPPPRGLLGMEASAVSRFATAEQMLEYYCATAQYMQDVPKAKLARIFHIYIAAMCHKLAGIANGVVARRILGNASDAQGAASLAAVVEHLSVQGVLALGLEPREKQEKPKSKI